MKKIAIIAGVVILLVIAAALILPSLIPSETYRRHLQEQLSDALGREVVLSGAVKLSTFPVIRAETDGVTISSPEGFTVGNLVELNALEARIRLLPLLARRVEISRFTLKRPVIHLERRADGAVNWSSRPAGFEATTRDIGPFTRDGRYTDLDVNIAALNIEDGELTFTDEVSGTTQALSRINSFLSLPGIDKTLIIDGSAEFDNQPVTLDLRLGSAADFLDGLETRLSVEGSIAQADFAATGVVPTGPSLAFSGRVDASTEDAGGLFKYLAQNVDFYRYRDAVTSATVSGDILVEPDNYAMDNGTIRASGPDFSASFEGSGRYAGSAVLDGKLDLDIADVAGLARLLPEPIEGLDLLTSATMQARIRTNADGVYRVDDVEATASGQGLSSSFSGQGRYSESIRLVGDFNAEVATPVAVVQRFMLDAKGAELFGPTTLRGRVELSGEDVQLSQLSAQTKGDRITAVFEGQAARRGETLSAAGVFDVSTPDAAELARTVQPDRVELAALAGTVRAKGSLHLDGEAIDVSDLVMTSESTQQRTRYEGDLRHSETTELSGRFEIHVPSLRALNDALPQDLSFADAVGQLSATGDVSGSMNTLVVSNLDATLRDGALNGQYIGSLRRNGNAAELDGKLEVNGPSLRKLSILSGATLPPSAPDAPVFETYSLQGTVGGSTSALSLSDASLRLDDLSATGEFGLRLDGDIPMLTGRLISTGLDLRPYVAAYSAQNPTGEIQPWSTQPIPAESLRAVDADVDIQVETVKLSRIALGRTELDVALRDGRIVTDIPSVNLYGGAGRGRFVMDGSQVIPTVELKADLKALNANSFLSAVAGFNRARGTAGTDIELRGSGRSQSAIMQSLNGSGTMRLGDGALMGIDVSKFLAGFEDALKTRSLPGGIGANKTTDFRDLDVTFNVKSGVAVIENFALDADGVSAEGAGSVDLGGQALDFRLRPHAEGDESRGLAKFGVPVRFSGAFGSASVSLDTEFLARIAVERARQEAADALTRSVGGKASEILGGIIGGKPPVPSKDTTPEVEPTPEVGDIPSTTQTPSSPTRRTPPPSPMETTPETNDDAGQDIADTEGEVGEALRDLLGLGRKKKTSDD